MSVAIELVCGCGRRSRERIFDGARPGAEVERLRIDSMGWTRCRPSYRESMRDYCPICTRERMQSAGTPALPRKGGAR